MRTSTALMVLAFIALAGIAFAQRQDESLDSLMLSSSLQPVNDPIPRLLQEALETASARPGTYGAAAATPSPINTVQAPAAPAAARSASSSAAAGVVSMLAAAAAAALML